MAKISIDYKHRTRIIEGVAGTEMLLNGWSIKEIKKDNQELHILRNKDGSPLYISDTPLDPGRILRKNSNDSDLYLSKVYNEKRQLNFPVHGKITNRIICKQYSTDEGHLDDYAVLIFNDSGKLLFDEERFCYAMDIDKVSRIQKLENIKDIYKISYNEIGNDGTLYGILNKDFIPMVMSINSLQYKTYENDKVVRLTTESFSNEDACADIYSGQDEIDFNLKKNFGHLFVKESKHYLDLLNQKRMEIINFKDK